MPVVMVLLSLLLVAITSIISVIGLRECWNHYDEAEETKSKLENLKQENIALNKKIQSQNNRSEYDEYDDYYGSYHRQKVKRINEKWISIKNNDSKGEEIVTDNIASLHNCEKDLHDDPSQTPFHHEKTISSEDITEAAEYSDIASEPQDFGIEKKKFLEMIDQPEPLEEEIDDGSISMSDIFSFVRSEVNSSKARYLRYNVETHTFDFISDPENEYILYEENKVVPNWKGRTRISNLNADAFEWSGEIDFVGSSNRIIPCEIDDMCHVTKKGLIL